MVASNASTSTRHRVLKAAAGALRPNLNSVDSSTAETGFAFVQATEAACLRHGTLKAVVPTAERQAGLRVRFSEILSLTYGGVRSIQVFLRPHPLKHHFEQSQLDAPSMEYAQGRYSSLKHHLEQSQLAALCQFEAKIGERSKVWIVPARS